MASRRISAWLPVLVWAAVIFAFSSIPNLGTGLGVWDTVLRKGAHTLEYAILGALLVRAIGREAPAFLAGVAYAVTDEFHQRFVAGRHSSPVDVAIDSCGVLLGVLTVRFALRRIPTMGRWPNGSSSTTASSTSSSSGSTTSSTRSAS
jgi:VanZ family protein